MKIPDQITGVPSIIPTCEKEKNVGDMYSSYSSESIDVMSKSSQSGFLSEIDLSVSVGAASIGSSKSISLQFGNSEKKREAYQMHEKKYSSFFEATA
jgi:hypothetical protein